MDKYLGAIKTAHDAKVLRERALEVGGQRMLDAAALLAPHRWRAVAARPELADKLKRAINDDARRYGYIDRLEG